MRASDLARFYRDRPQTASDAYDGRSVLLALTIPERHGSELHWHIAGREFPPVVVCQFSGPVPAVAPVVWVTGTCRGRVADGGVREFTGYDFHVLVTDCRIADPPAIPKP